MRFRINVFYAVIIFAGVLSAALFLFSCSSDDDGSPTSAGGSLQPPAGPPVIRAQSILLRSITVTCSARVAGAATYGIFRSLSDTGVFTSVGETADTAFTDTGLADTTRYYYRAKAGNAAGWTAFSNTASAVTLALPASAPLPPLGFSAEAASSSSARLAWSAAATGPAAASFEIYRSLTASPDTQSLVAEVAGFSHTDAGLVAGTPYYYFIRAKNSAGVSAFRIAFVTLPSAPQAPQNVTALAVSPSSILISWRPEGVLADSITYHVYRSSSASGSFVLVAKTGSASYLDNGLSASTAYYYKIKAENITGLSAFSGAASAATPADQSGGYDLYVRDTGSYAYTSGRIVSYGFQVEFYCSCATPQPFACTAYTPVPDIVYDTSWHDYSLNGNTLIVTDNDTTDSGCVSALTTTFTRSAGGSGLEGTWVSTQKPSFIESGPCDTGFMSQKMTFDSLSRVEQTLVLGPGTAFSRTVRADFSLCWAAYMAQALAAEGIDSPLVVSNKDCATAFITANQETLFIVFDMENGTINYTYENKSCFNYWLNDNPPPDCSQEACLEDLYRAFWTNIGAGLGKAAGTQAAVPAPAPLRVKAFHLPRF